MSKFAINRNNQSFFHFHFFFHSSTAVTHCLLVATQFIDPERMKAWVELVCSGRWTSDLQYDTHEWTCAGVASDLTNWASQTDTLLERNEANMSGKEFESTVDGSCEVGLRWRSLLIEFQSLRGFEDDEEMSEELKTFLAWIMAEW